MKAASSKWTEAVISETAARGFRVERLPSDSRRNQLDKRRLLIEGKRCQVIPSHLGNSNPEYLYAEYHPLYLPRTDWPDFLLYVSTRDQQPIFHIVPRTMMSKDTGRSPGSLEPFRDAWELLQLDSPIESSEKGLEILTWQLVAIKRSAQRAGLDVEFIKTKKSKDGRSWPPFVKRRLLVGGQNCAVFSATRLSKDPQDREYCYAVFKATKETWPQFQLFVLRDSEDLFVVPRLHITRTNTASLDHPELARYKNAWHLLSVSPESLQEMSPIVWKEPAVPAPPTKHTLILEETMREAARLGFHVDFAGEQVESKNGVQSFLLVNGKHCQVLQTTVIAITSNCEGVFLYRPKSTWADFLIFYATRSNVLERFYIIPKEELHKNTTRSVKSKWLTTYQDAWRLLQ